MASRSKKPHLTPDNTESSSSSESDNSEGEEEEFTSTDELQVEFEARTPEEVDYHGICGLLRKAFRSGIDIGALADYIIRQRTVGSVVTQSHDNDDSDVDEDEPNNEVFGVATVIKLAKDHALSDQIVQYLVQGTSRCDKGEDFRRIVRDADNQLGLIVSERIINMPPQISVPLYETLLNEIRKARAKNLPFNFSHYLLVSKIMCPPNDDRNMMFTNAEEEVFVGECDLVLNLADEGEGNRSFATAFSQDEMVDQRRLLVFKAEKLEKIVGLVKNSFPIS